MNDRPPNSLESGPAESPKSAPGMDAERWLAAIVESSDDAILGESLDGIITSWNAGATRIFGYTEEEAIGKPISWFAWPGEEDRIEELLRRLRLGERIDHFETIRKHKTGRKVIVSLSLSPILDSEGSIIGIAKIARDITERKAAEEALAASELRLRAMTEQEALARADVLAERRFRELIEHAPDAILQIDTTGKIIVANNTAVSMFGYTREELLGMSVDRLVPEVSRAAHPGHRNAFAAAGVTRPMGQGLDLRARRKNGTEVPVEISLSPVKTDQGIYITAAIRDVTERKRIEAQVRLLEIGYFQELEARKEEAERLNRLKSEFLASMSHELRTPLHTIIGFSELLAEESEGPLSEEQRRFLGHIHRDSEHLLALINDVLDFSRIEAGGLNLQAEVLPLGDAISEAVNAIRPRAEAKGISMLTDTDGNIQVSADQLRLRQILYNLLSNAVKFTPAGGTISVSIASVPAEQSVRITVSDTGIGIADEERVHIFDKFYQVGVTTGGVREGTGLGLAICKQLIEMHGGSIWVEGAPGRGSRFHFTLRTPLERDSRHMTRI
jgi:PAS domain S-box-containing protein